MTSEEVRNIIQQGTHSAWNALRRNFLGNFQRTLHNNIQNNVEGAVWSNLLGTAAANAWSNARDNVLHNAERYDALTQINEHL